MLAVVKPTRLATPALFHDLFGRPTTHNVRWPELAAVASKAHPKTRKQAGQHTKIERERKRGVVCARARVCMVRVYVLSMQWLTWYSDAGVTFVKLTPCITAYHVIPSPANFSVHETKPLVARERSPAFRIAPPSIGSRARGVLLCPCWACTCTCSCAFTGCRACCSDSFLCCSIDVKTFQRACNIVPIQMLVVMGTDFPRKTAYFSHRNAK